MNSTEIRKKFLDFFKKNNHIIVPSSPLIPAEDPTLLFTNAGMNQFKDLFLGKEKRSYKRATSIQKCVRAGGKHNDLEQVGFTERHLTLFEMMGNFSFGDYFKKEAIKYAWDFLTNEMKFAPEKLYPSVFEKDDETFELWNKLIGIPKDKITKLGEKDNFWQMGDTGPCGPCTEIYFDTGTEKSCGQPTCKPGCDCARYIEIWNLVFMQFNRQNDGNLKPLEQTGVDTGMGFERLCMVSQGVNNVYETDVFQQLIKHIEDLTKIKYSKSSNKAVAFRVLCDHIRSSCLIIADGGTPSNEGRGYVLRKIIRRAALFANKLTTDTSLFPKLGQSFINEFSFIYPELKKNEDFIIKLLTSEINRFINNLTSGEVILEKYIEENKAAGNNTLSGNQVFKLYDTYGFPIELTSAVARERNLSIDIKGFEKNMEIQQQQSGKKNVTELNLPEIPKNIKTKFTGYDDLENKSKIIFIEKDADNSWIVTEESPFYVESGGQVNDSGFISINKHSYPVIDLKKTNGAILVKVPTNNIKIGDLAHSIVNAQDRTNSVRNHSATHLLHAALQQVLNENIKQAGSLVNPEYLRFDFNYPEALSEEQLNSIENLINQKIQEDIKTNSYHTTLVKAKEAGAAAFFGEKYDPENVRVVEVPGFSIELCGGTHAPRTGIIGSFKILSEASLSTGVRRITAITGPKALELFQNCYKTIKSLGEEFKVKSEDVLSSVKKLQRNYLDSLSEIKTFKKQLLKNNIPQWQAQVKKIKNIPFLYLELEDLSNEELKNICTSIEQKNPGFYFLISKNSQEPTHVSFLGYLSKEFTNTINFKEFGNFLKDKLKLRGGGSQNLIQGGGILQNNTAKEIENWITNKAV